MAEAEIKTVAKTVYEEGVTLTLTRAEAADLALVTRHISGDADRTARGTMSTIGAALSAAGVDYIESGSPRPTVAMRFPDLFDLSGSNS